MREVRAVKVDDAEVRKDTTTEALNFRGHAAVFNQRTWIGPKKWGFWEELDSGFFDDVLGDDAAFLVNHDPNIVLARNGKTMTLTTDKRGLVADAQWDPTDPDAVKWAGRVNRGDVSQMSFAFTVAEEKWAEDPDTGEETRTLLKAEQLFDASLVTYPAYAGTDGGMRDSVAEVVKRHRGFDPRDEKRQGDPAVPANPVKQTEPAPIDKPAAPPIVEPVTDPAETPGPTVTPEEPLAPAESVARSLQVLRHRLLAAKYHLPVTRDIIAVGPLDELLEDGGSGGEDEEEMTEVMYLQEMIEHHQEAVAMSVMYLTLPSDERTTGPSDMATGIITGQTAEIQLMAGWLSASGQSGSQPMMD